MTSSVPRPPSAKIRKVKSGLPPPPVLVVVPVLAGGVGVAVAVAVGTLVGEGVGEGAVVGEGVGVAACVTVNALLLTSIIVCSFTAITRTGYACGRAVADTVSVTLKWPLLSGITLFSAIVPLFSIPTETASC